MLLYCWGHQLGRIISTCMCEPAFVRKPLIILPNSPGRASICARLYACLHWYQSLLTPVYVERSQRLSRRLAPVRDRMKTPLMLEQWDLFSVLACQWVVFTLSNRWNSLAEIWLRYLMRYFLRFFSSVYKRIFFPPQVVKLEGMEQSSDHLFFPFCDIAFMNALSVTLFCTLQTQLWPHLDKDSSYSLLCFCHIHRHLTLQQIQFFWWMCTHVIVSAQPGQWSVYTDHFCQWSINNLVEDI